MNTASLRSLTSEELDARVRELRRNLFDQQIKHRTGQLRDTSSLRGTRRDLARALTIQTERDQRAGAGEPEGA